MEPNVVFGECSAAQMVVNAAGLVNVTGMMRIMNDTHCECGMNVIECTLCCMQWSGTQHELRTQQITLN